MRSAALPDSGGTFKGAASRYRRVRGRMEPSSGRRCRPGGRLDMSHGFVRHIRRNQLARDAYERSVRQARGRARGRHTATPPRPRRPDQPVYRARRAGSSSPGSPPPPPHPPRGPRLFCLDYEGDDGTVTSVIVHQGDSAEEVTRRVCARSPLEPALRSALCCRVRDEIGKRMGGV